MIQIDLSQRIAVVTGGGSGIGYASAERFLRCGATVELWGRSAAKLAEAQAALAPLGPLGRLSVQSVDVSRWEQVEAASRDVLARLGRVDILFNCAGVSLQACPTFQTSLADWHEHIAANLDSTFYCSRAFGPGMVERGFGRIINTSSMAGKDGNPMQAAYSAAKGGVIAFTKSLAKELATSGVTVNAIAPTLFDTPLAQSVMAGSPTAMQGVLDKIPMKRVGRAEEAAAMVAWIASDECSFTTGFTFDLSGGRATY